MRKSAFEKRYICVGENFVDNCRIGYCGDVHTLKEWLKLLFPNADAVEYFADDSPKAVLEYIYQNMGKRLQEFK